MIARLTAAAILIALILTATPAQAAERRDDQWALDTLAAEQAWTRTTGEGQIIAIIDTGVDGRHPDLRRQLVPGFSTFGTDPLVDPTGHGTHTAGIAAGRGGDNYGITGVAPGAGIMPVQVTDANGFGHTDDLAEGLVWAVDHGATVANISLTGTAWSSALDAAIGYAADHDVVVVAAAGNTYLDGNPTNYPAANPTVLTVGAMRDDATRAAFSSTGGYVDLMAPGIHILSSLPDFRFGYASGTSSAAPLVAGAAALLRSLAPDLTALEVVDVLQSTATDRGVAGRDDIFGDGVLDLSAAIVAVAGPGPSAAAQMLQGVPLSVIGS